MRRALSLARHHPILSLIFVSLIVAMLVFGANIARKTLYWMDPAHQAQTIEPWMTPKYIARSWGLDAPALAAQLGVQPQTAKRPTLSDIAKARGMTEAEIIAEVEAYIAAQSSNE